MALSSSWHPGGRRVILHKIKAKKMEVDIEVNSVLEALQSIEEFGSSISDGMKTVEDKSKCGKEKFEDYSRRLSVMDDQVTLAIDMVSRAILELKIKPPEIRKGVAERSRQSLGDILIQRLERKESELSMNLELLQLSLGVLRDLLKKFLECGEDGAPPDCRSTAQLETLFIQVSDRVEEKEKQLLRVWKCLENWEKVAKGAEQEKSDSHSSGYHAWSTSIQEETAPTSRLSAHVSTSHFSGGEHLQKLQGCPVTTAESIEHANSSSSREKIEGKGVKTSPTFEPLLSVQTARPVVQVEQAQWSQVKVADNPPPSHTLLLQQKPFGSSISHLGSDIGQISTAPEEDMHQMHVIQRKKLMTNLQKSFGVWGEPPEVGQDYPGHKVVFQEGTPAGFWVNFDTSARRNLQKRIQEYLVGAEPASAEMVKEGGLLLARYGNEAYRAIVLRVTHKESGLLSASVRYIDWGNEEEGVLGYDLYSWDPLLEEISPQAICVRLRGVSDTLNPGFSYSKEQVDAFAGVMSQCDPFRMVVHKRLRPASSVFYHNVGLPGPEVEVSLVSKSGLNIVSTLASYPAMSGIFSEDLSICLLPGPFQASPHLESSSPCHPTTALPPTSFDPGMPKQAVEEKVSSWLEGLQSTEQMVDKQCVSTIEELPTNQKTLDDPKQEEEPVPVKGDRDHPSIGTSSSGDPEQIDARTSAPFLDQQEAHLSENRQFRWLLSSISNPGEIWLHPVQDTSFCLVEIEASMASSVPHQLDRESIVHIGSCWTVSSANASFPLICKSPWVRVRLEKILEDEYVSVRSIDYGVLLNMPKANLHHLPPGPASALPGIAVCCSLAGILPPTGGWTEQATAAAFGLLDTETVRLALVPELQNKDCAKFEVVLSTLGVESGAPNLFTTTLNGELLELGHAVPDSEVSSALLRGENWEEDLETWDPIALAYHNISNNYITNDNDVQLATQGYTSRNPVCHFFQNRGGHCWKGKYCPDKHQLVREGAVTADLEEVMVDSLPRLPSFPVNNCSIRVLLVHAVSPSSFYLRFPNDNHDAAQLSPGEQLRIYNPRHEKFKTSLTKFYEENPKRYLLSSLPAPGSLIVVKKENVWERALVLDEDDFGEELRVFLVDEGESTKIRLNNISLAHQAVHCRLSNVEPLADSWSIEANAFFASFVEKTNLRAKMSSEGLPLLEVQLYQHVVGNETSLANLLVKQGWARERKVAKNQYLNGADLSPLERSDLKRSVYPG